MKHLIQSLKNGAIELVDIPVPALEKGEILVRSSLSLISPGTEKMMLDFGNANYIDKVRQQPQKAKMVLDKVKTDGLAQTIEAVKSKLSKPISLGYSSVGIVIDKADDISEVSVGDRVITNSSHSEISKVSRNLFAKVPDNVSDESAVFTVISSIALQGVRLAKPNIGDNYVVIGVGLIGLLTVQILIANGCNVLAIDFDESRLDLAKSYGANICNPNKSEDSYKKVMSHTNNIGADGVIITASTNSSEPISSAANMCRKRGKIILVGVSGLNINRDDFYEKELSFQVSCSYGPGRYDSDYEQKGIDYPVGFVRWTEKRNFEAVLNLLSQQKINVEKLISKKVEFKQADLAYKELLKGNNNYLGVIFEYEKDNFNGSSIVKLEKDNQKKIANKIKLGCIGAGDYSSKILIPLFRKEGISMNTIVSASGLSSSLLGKANNFEFSSTNTNDVLDNNEINLVAVATRHNTHAKFVIKALNANKNIYVEKPLCISFEELDEIKEAYYDASSKKNRPHLMVGFNRRFAPHSKKIKELITRRTNPITVIYTVNAGKIPQDHWIQDMGVGGGRVIGEACHFIDLMRFYVGSKIISYTASKTKKYEKDYDDEDNYSINLMFEDGSIATIHYFSNGASSYPKEKIELFSEGRILSLDNFRKLKGHGWKNFSSMNLFNQDKGQKNCIRDFLASLNTKEALIHPDEIFEISKISMEISRSLSE